VTVTFISGESAAPCTGDCNDDHHVTVDELVTGVATALGNAGAGACDSLDTDADGHVTVDELVAAIARALGGCP
jgi:hypothetical protein